MRRKRRSRGRGGGSSSPHKVAPSRQLIEISSIARRSMRRLTLNPLGSTLYTASVVTTTTRSCAHMQDPCRCWNSCGGSARHPRLRDATWCFILMLIFWQTSAKSIFSPLL